MEKSPMETENRVMYGADIRHAGQFLSGENAAGWVLRVAEDEHVDFPGTDPGFKVFKIDLVAAAFGVEHERIQNGFDLVILRPGEKGRIGRRLDQDGLTRADERAAGKVVAGDDPGNDENVLFFDGPLVTISHTPDDRLFESWDFNRVSENRMRQAFLNFGDDFGRDLEVGIRYLRTSSKWF